MQSNNGSCFSKPLNKDLRNWTVSSLVIFFLPFETQLKEIVCEMVKMSDATCFYVWGTPNRNHQRIRSNIKLNEINFFIMWQAPFCRRNYPQNGKMSSYRHHLAFACEKCHKKHLLNWIDHFLCEWSVFVFLKWQALKRNHLQNGLLSSWGRYLFHHLKRVS